MDEKPIAAVEDNAMAAGQAEAAAAQEDSVPGQAPATIYYHNDSVL